MTTFVEEALHVDDDLAEAVEPFGQFRVQFLVRPSLRYPPVKLRPGWHGSDGQLKGPRETGSKNKIKIRLRSKRALSTRTVTADWTNHPW